MDDRRFDEDFGATLAALRSRRGACPDADRLAGWQAGESIGAERDAISRHVALCPTCTFLVERLGGQSAPADDVAWERARRNLDRAPRPWRRSPGRRRLPFAAAAAALVLAASLLLWLRARPDPETTGVVRSAHGLRAIAPAGRVDELEFRWSAPPIHDRFRLEIAEGDAVVATREARGSPLRADGSLRARLVAGRPYRWRVVAVTAEGEARDDSPWTEFRLSR
jgi:hypothetical protein